MATTNFLWVISQLNCAVESDGLPNVINVIHYRYQATQVDGEKTWFAETYGATSVGQPNPQNFVPYEDVTEAEVIGWLEEILPVEAMQLALENNIALQINPVEVTLPLPWLPTTTTTTTLAPENI
tara:strand:+ start:435 stop:809 length:375 start_codon:yes stop_codon:yes gene_type:complete